ncbi:N-terminal acetyltransferase B complex auxiliary subunit NAA25-like isoform X2 [Andrographis paniculata]|nr:N-terminal acetyltransferase B complex auxiliary subunit NAA25-like isoform X2 [Andrographis paniculata]
MTSEVDKLQLQGRLLAKLGDYAGATNVFCKVVELRPDDWACFQRYLGGLLEDGRFFTKMSGAVHPYTKQQNLSLSEEVFDSRISNAVTLVEKLMAKHEQSIPRCLYLAKVEIGRIKLLFGRGDADVIVEDLVQYFMRFGHFGCLMSEITMLVEVLDHDRKSLLLKKLLECCDASNNLPIKALGQSISILKLRDMIDDNMQTLSIEDLKDQASQVIEKFLNATDAEGNKYRNDLLGVASKTLIKLFQRTGDLGYLIESTMLLEFGLLIRGNVDMYKFVLMRVYSCWNSLPLAFECYKYVDMKKAFLSSISQYIVSQIIIAVLWPEMDDFIGAFMKFMDDELKESADRTFLAYYSRNYSHALRFVQNSDKLLHSVLYSMLRIEVPILQLKKNSNNIEVLKEKLEITEWGVACLGVATGIISKPMATSQDLKRHPCWTPTNSKKIMLGLFEGASHFPRESRDNCDSELEAHFHKTLLLRSLIPRLLYLSLRSASESIEDIIEVDELVLNSNLSTELKTLLERFARTLEFPFLNAVELILGVSISQKSFEELEPDVSLWMSFAVFLNGWNMQSHEIRISSTEPSTLSTWHLVNSLLKKSVEEKIKSASPITTSPGYPLLILIQLVTEPLTWQAVILQSCVASILDSGVLQSSEKNSFSKLLLLFELQNSIKSLKETLAMVAKWLSEQITESGDAKLALLSMLETAAADETIAGPGKTFQTLRSRILKQVDDEAVQSWTGSEVIEELVTGQVRTLSEFLFFCESKIMMLDKLNASLLNPPTDDDDDEI